MTIDWDSALNISNHAVSNAEGMQPTSDKSTLDRILSPFGNYSIVNGLYNLTDDNPDTGFFGGMLEGVTAMNPFSDTEAHTTSDLLGNLGWQPEHLPGKIAKGVLGFTGDVLLDPMTYINPFSAAGKVMKGTGTVIKGAKGLEHVVGLSSKQAKAVIDGFYAARNIDPPRIS